MNCKFTDIWERRDKIQLNVMKDWVNNEWAKGRNRYLTFLVRIKDKGLVEKMIEIQDRLSIIPCVDPFPKNYFHITVKGCGFLAKSEKYEDDVSIESLQKIINRAEEVLQTFNNFDIFLSKLNIFSDVVLIEVYDDGKIGELNKRLQAIPEIRKMRFDHPNLLPHVSIAQFQNNEEFARLIADLEKIRDIEFGTVTINSIQLVIAHLHKKYPKLETIHTFRSKQQQN
jgi:2'-5' RNA ligase